MKKLILIVFMLQFPLFCFAQSDNTHHYTDQEVTKLSNYINDLEKKISSTHPSENDLADKKQITTLLNDTSHNYADGDIIRIFKYIKDLEKKLALNKMLNNDTEIAKVPVDSAQAAILLVKGSIIFEGSESKNDYSTVSITVTNKENNQTVGIYKPNSRTGKYLFILNPGEKYLITTVTQGYQNYSQDFFPENKTESYEINQEIRLKKE